MCLYNLSCCSSVVTQMGCPIFLHAWISWRLLSRNWWFAPTARKFLSNFGIMEEFGLKPFEFGKGISWNNCCVLSGWSNGMGIFYFDFIDFSIHMNLLVHMKLIVMFSWFYSDYSCTIFIHFGISEQSSKGFCQFFVFPKEQMIFQLVCEW